MTPAAKARKMWTNNMNRGVEQIFIHSTPDAFTDAFPVLVIPADRASLQAAVERAAATILGVSDRQWQLQVEEYLKRDYRIRSKAALEAAWGVKLK